MGFLVFFLGPKKQTSGLGTNTVAIKRHIRHMIPCESANGHNHRHSPGCSLPCRWDKQIKRSGAQNSHLSSTVQWKWKPKNCFVLTWKYDCFASNFAHKTFIQKNNITLNCEFFPHQKTVLNKLKELDYPNYLEKSLYKCYL